VRIEAFEALLRAGAPGVAERLAGFAEKGDARSAFLAALVFGRVRRPEFARPLAAAWRRADLSQDARTMCLLGVVLSNDAAYAETAVRAMADDRSEYDAKKSVAQYVAVKLSEATPEFRRAAGAAVVRALSGAFGEPSGAGLLHLLGAAAACCGDEASSVVAARLTHADVVVRSAAAGALAYVAGPDALRDLRAAWWRSADPTLRSEIAAAMERAACRFVPSGR
jgi:hypothetical protein